MAVSPLLTIVVTTHRRPAQLAVALRSIRDQIVPGRDAFPVEIILCDDSGCAETRRVAADLLGEGDSLISRPGLRGPAESRNLGLDVARAPWVGFLDDDDCLTQGWFAALRPLLAEGGRRLIFGDYLLCDAAGANGRRIDLADAPLDRLPLHNMIHSSAYVVPHDIVARFEPALRSHEDWDFLLAVSREIPFQHVPVIASEYRMAEAGNRNDVGGLDLAAAYLAVYARYPSGADKMRRERRKHLRAMGLKSPPKDI